MKTIKFDEIKPDLEKAINEKLKNGLVVDPQGFVLMDGFCNITFNKEINSSIIIGNPFVPCISIIGKSTGLIYTFALKALIPTLEL